jgi:1-acyl-sn-glycerol-3-phosphate acyltransferase
MNRQPFQTPTRRWDPQLTPWIVRMMRPLIRRDLRRQRILEIETRGLDHVRQALSQPAGVLLTPNHSFHYDSYVLIEISHRLQRPFHFLTAWQVFEMGRAFDRWMLQRHGCYSINREGNDVQAFKTSVDILQNSTHPLVVFPEGDIYHHNDRVSPFRDGAAAIALSAAKRSERPIVAIPCAVKAFYLTDPRPELTRLMTQLEATLHWRPHAHLDLSERIYRFAGGLLSLKELEYLNEPKSGDVRDRAQQLAAEVLQRLESKYQLKRNSDEIPDRVKEARRAVIAAMEREEITSDQLAALEVDLDDLFFVIQLYSYPGDYVVERPVIERIAETLDKFEEDVLHVDYPAIRGDRHVVVQFGEPITIPNGRDGKPSVADWTDRLEQQVQSLLDDINAHPPAKAIRA